MSRTSASGEVCVDTPPRRSNSASCNEVRNSYRVSPPSMTPMNGASGFSTLFIWARTEGRSLIQCKLKELSTASNEFAS